jgi:hypothetical protein
MGGISVMGNGISRILFDHRDYELLGIVNDVLNRKTSFVYLKNLLYPYMHPRGIKEMAASRGLRMAYAAVHLLESLEVGKADGRLTALRCLRDEVMCSGTGPMQNNTARVLLVVMKELVRTRDDKLRQLQLAHDFCNAASGKPRVIRALLRRYHLLEMPEEWNQITFDDHVHDVNTKGRKSPSHLIMDAWIKGIRQLTIIYYNHVGSKAAEELLEAAEIMDIEVRIGVEFWARFRGRYIQLIWVPRGFYDARDFLSFLADPIINSFMDEGRKASEHQQQYVMAVLREFNERHLPEVNESFGLNLPLLDVDAFRSFVGAGQASILHLAEFIYMQLVPAMQARVAELKERYPGAHPEERNTMERQVDEMKSLDSEEIVERYLRPAKNPSTTDPHVPRDDPGTPDLLKLTPSELVERLDQLHSGYRITLNLSNLKVEDVLELLYDCKGAISHLEIFNLKDHITGKSSNYDEISLLQRSINEGNVIALKKHIRGIIQRVEAVEDSCTAERVEKFKEILCNIGALQAYYKETPLKTRIGSDSTGRSRRLHGMGLAIKDTLPHRAQKEAANPGAGPRLTIPVRTDAYLRTTYIPNEHADSSEGRLYRLMSSIPGLRMVGLETKEDWVVQDSSIRIVNKGNIVSLGGIREEPVNGLCLHESRQEVPRIKISWKHLNGVYKNALKVLIGFIPAFATFYLTKDWWFLAYLGAFIWFGITGLRNILQSVLGAGGIRRSPLLKWDSYVSWDRLTDSLLFTGFSVPLLEYLVKTLILDQSFGITISTNPVLLYTCIAVANGLYIFSHNIWRGLPKAAAVGNLFRTVLSIPLAIALSAGIGAVLGGFGVAEVAIVLQKWAAIISKTASDCVAGVIEGLADRHHNIRDRSRDYAVKLAQLFDTYAQMELIFPEVDVLKMLDSPKDLLAKIGGEGRDLEKIIIMNALDLLYFWMYQPRARSVLCSLMKAMSDEERQILVRSQSVLRRKREVSQLFVDGIVGKKFAEALSFYLDRSDGYLDAIEDRAYRCDSVDHSVYWPIRLRNRCEFAIKSLKTWSNGKSV